MSFKDRNKPWLTRDIFETIHERDQYILEYIKGGKHDPDLLECAKQAHHDINAKTRISEENYYNKKLSDLAGHPTKFWRELNLLLGKAGENKPAIVLQHHETGTEIEGREVPPYINGFFAGEKLFSSLGNVPKVAGNSAPTITPSMYRMN